LVAGVNRPIFDCLLAFAHGTDAPGVLSAPAEAAATARLLVYCALLASSCLTSQRYIATAIDLLDRLCDPASQMPRAHCDHSSGFGGRRQSRRLPLGRVQCRDTTNAPPTRLGITSSGG
jgi:hypothetical protein